LVIAEYTITLQTHAVDVTQVNLKIFCYMIVCNCTECKFQTVCLYPLSFEAF